MSIEARKVGKRFGDFVALDEVDLWVKSGGLTALLGPSGGGKSTLLRIIAGLERADTGAVLIEGVDSTGVPAQRRGVGFVFQHYAAFKHLSVFRNVAFGLEIRKRPKDEIRARVHELLELVHLSQFADRLPSQLSGGQRQRMALARALAVEPKVLLLDEPFGALDTQVRKELRDWLRRLHDEVQVTTIFVTHDQEEALEVADQLVVINHGRVEQVGSPDELYERPSNPFVMGFLGQVTSLAGRLIRPHDIEIFTAHIDDGVPARITRLHRVGFEVRAEVDSPVGESWVQLTRGQAEGLGLSEGCDVWLRAAPHAAALSLQDYESADLSKDGLRGSSVAESGGAGAGSGQSGRDRLGAGTAAQVRRGDPR
ncbi:MAG: sulfate ABC transporter ATP-binding protein [Actinomycetota bacterium]|nr:sulfate ABC transporter ATP-binding protein [Actinomycetota bacterium]